MRCLGLGKDERRAQQETINPESTRQEARRQEEEARAQREREQKAAEEQRLASRRAAYAAMTPLQREKAIREACAGTACDTETTKFIIEAASSDQERTKLAREFQTLEAAAEARQRAKEAQARAHAAQAMQPVQERAQVLQPAPKPEGRVCCCDGSISPTCTTVHRGCCSRHGGVCACN
jgi:hypothetical protein